MLKIFAWAGVGLGAVAFGTSWIGLGIFALVLGSMSGVWIGAHGWLLGIYIAVGMVTAYGIPLSWAWSEGRRDPQGRLHVVNGVGALLVGLIVTSALFAVPSSFAAGAGCTAGHTNAYRAMQVIPFYAIGQQFLAPDGDPSFSCAGFIDA